MQLNSACSSCKPIPVGTFRFSGKWNYSLTARSVRGPRSAPVAETEAVLEKRYQIRSQRVTAALLNSSAILLVHNLSGLPRSLECES